MKDEKTYIKRVKLEGIHKRYDLDIELNETLNVLHGQNGTGKSTLLHIIANVANCDFIRFAFIEFERIEVNYSNGSQITIIQEDSDEGKSVKVKARNSEELSFNKNEAIKTLREKEDDRFSKDFTPLLTRFIEDYSKKNDLKSISTSYFPAFRTMLEAISNRREDSDFSRMRTGRYTAASKKATTFSRNLFGEFLPIINFPSPMEIEANLIEELREAQLAIARYESSVFSESFVKVFSALLKKADNQLDAEKILTEIAELTNLTSSSKGGMFEEVSGTYEQLRILVNEAKGSVDMTTTATGALAVYRDALKQREEVQSSSFMKVDKYFEAVNVFLDKKELSYEINNLRRSPKVGLKFPDGTWSSIRAMSSGERQLLTMLYAVNKMSGNSVVLIDEPEISLHIDWQEELLSKMLEQLGERQIIVCTHSPSIAAGFDDYMKEVKPRFKSTGKTELNMDDDEDLL